MFSELIHPELLVLVPVLFVLGTWIKKIPSVKAYLMPFIIMLASIVLVFLHTLGQASYAFDVKMIASTTLQGVFVALFAIGGNQISSQLKFNKKDASSQSDEMKSPQQSLPEMPYENISEDDSQE